MNNRLYIGNLSFDTNAESVRSAFAALGQVADVYLVTDRATGRSRGFAFVTMSTPEEAARAIQEMDGRMLDGRPLRVNEAEQKPRGGGGGGGAADSARWRWWRRLPRRRVAAVFGGGGGGDRGGGYGAIAAADGGRGAPRWSRRRRRWPRRRRLLSAKIRQFSSQ